MPGTCSQPCDIPSTSTGAENRPAIRKPPHQRARFLLGIDFLFARRHVEADLLDRADQRRQLRHVRIELDRSGMGGEVHVRRRDPGRGRELPLDGTRTRRAGHPGDRKIHTLPRPPRSFWRSRHRESELLDGAISLGTAVCAGSNCTVAEAASRFTLALDTPEVEASFRSTLRAQLPQVIPATGSVTVSALIPI